MARLLGGNIRINGSLSAWLRSTHTSTLRLAHSSYDSTNARHASTRGAKLTAAGAGQSNERSSTCVRTVDAGLAEAEAFELLAALSPFLEPLAALASLAPFLEPAFDAFLLAIVDV